jgi:hypothetical protein
MEREKNMMKHLPLARRLALLISLALLVAACGRGNREEATAVPPTATPAAAAAPATPTAAPAAAEAEPTEAPAAVEETAEPAEEEAQASVAGDDPVAVVSNAMAAQFSGGPYRALTTVESEGTITEMSAEVVPPANMHIVIGGGNMEVILLDGTLWSKTGGSEWMQMGSPEMMQGMFDMISGQIERSELSNVQFVGSEPVMGEQADVYAFTSTLGEGEQVMVSEVKLWISEASGLPIRMESTSSGAGVTSKATQTIEYDSTITVEAPQ